jgi:hypothetical protein
MRTIGVDRHCDTLGVHVYFVGRRKTGDGRSLKETGGGRGRGRRKEGGN